MNAKDLREVEPALLDCRLDGYAGIPCMLDKTRATIVGTQGRAVADDGGTEIVTVTA